MSVSRHTRYQAAIVRDGALLLLRCAFRSGPTVWILPGGGREAGEDEARALQLVIEYDPQPPYDSGSLEKAEPETRQRATELLTRGVA